MEVIALICATGSQCVDESRIIAVQGVSDMAVETPSPMNLHADMTHICGHRRHTADLYQNVHALQELYGDRSGNIGQEDLPNAYLVLPMPVMTTMLSSL